MEPYTTQIVALLYHLKECEATYSDNFGEIPEVWQTPIISPQASAPTLPPSHISLRRSTTKMTILSTLPTVTRAYTDDERTREQWHTWYRS